MDVGSATEISVINGYQEVSGRYDTILYYTDGSKKDQVGVEVYIYNLR